MTIKIETKKVVTSDGVLSREIIKINLLNRDKLPALYTAGYPNCYSYESWGTPVLQIETKTTSVSYREGSVVSDDEWNKALKKIHECGDRLMQINKLLKKLKENWNGTETFII